MTTVCQRKARYATEGLALVMARRRAAQTGEIIKQYACTDCGGWHLGHPSLPRPAAGRRDRRRR